MAIIYTYPKLTNPQGNELIVVSDVNNRNSTRLITIASIASLVPSGGGCSTAITGIVDNLGAPLYTALACSDMELVSTDGSVDIAATATGIDLTVDAAFDLECASAATLGGFLANTVAIAPPSAAGSGTYYPVEVTEEGCTGIVRVPDSASISCAEPTVIGGVKALKNTTETVMPDVAEEGNYYPIEVVNAPGAASNDLCRAIVKVPAGEGSGCSDVFKTITNTGGTFTFDASGCSDTLTFGSTGGTVTITSLVQGNVNLEVAAPPCATTSTRGGIIVGSDDTAIDPGIDETGTAYAVEVNTTCEAFVRVPAGGGEGAAQGFSPLDIYNGQGLLTGPFTIASQTVGDLTLNGVNRVDVFIRTANPNSTVQCHVWAGEMTNPAGAVFKGSGSLLGLVSGINTITLSAMNLEAGKPLVIYFTMDNADDINQQILVGPGITDAALCQGDTNYTAAPSNNLVTALTPLVGGGEVGQQRIACHFYKV